MCAQQYQAVLEMPELENGERAEIQLQIGHALMHDGQYEEARHAYSQLARDTSNVSALRAIAALAFAHCFEREKNYTSAAAEFAKIAAESDLPAHLRQEASERAEEMRRLGAGLPLRDPAEHRVHVPARPKPGRTLYVAPHGTDTNPGTRQQPLASLEGRGMRSDDSKQVPACQREAWKYRLAEVSLCFASHFSLLPPIRGPRQLRSSIVRRMARSLVSLGV